MSKLSRNNALVIAGRALALFGISGDARIDFVKQRENVVFRVTDSSDSYALRIHRQGHRSGDDVRTENAYMVALRDAGVPVPEVVPSMEGRLFAVVDDGSGHEYLVDVQRWVPHSAPLGDAVEAWRGQDGPRLESFTALGAICGQFHSASRRIGRITGFSRPAWDAEGLTGAAPLWGDPLRLAETQEDRAVISAALTGISQELSCLGVAPDVYGVIHSDFTPENVLLANGELTLIDFDDFGEGWWLFDLATVLFWYHRHPRAREYREALLAGYRQHVQIPSRALQALDTLVLARGLTYLGWAADRPEDGTSAFIRSELGPVLVDMCHAFNKSRGKADVASGSDRNSKLLARRVATIGPYSPLFYDRPLHFVAGEGAWLTDVEGNRYLDAYNNVPQVGHANPRVAGAVGSQLHTYNVHTRYLSEPVVDYAEELLSTFDARLDRVYFTNSGSEANELALRIARHRTGQTGVIVTSHSYHGNTIALAELTTGLTVAEPLGKHVRTIEVPDLDGPLGGDADEMLSNAFVEVDRAIASLMQEGHGIAALLVEPAFSTEGLPRLPEGYLPGITERVRAAGGLVISDEVQAGLGRLGDVWWGHQATGIVPDLVTLGKPLGNGYPLGAVVTTQAILEHFSRANMYFNTFAGTPAAAAAGLAVLAEIRDRGLVVRTGDLGRHVASRLTELAARQPRVSAAKGRGLFFGLALVDERGLPDGQLAKRIVESLVEQGILISRIGPHDNVLKIRPPLVITRDELDRVIDALNSAFSSQSSTVPARDS